jgi:UDP-galactopyranose mutase
MIKKVAIIGAGFSGAVIARELAINNIEVVVFESRSHVAGNCHTARDPATQIMIHTFGPHIFHTNNRLVWDYVNRFDEFMPFINRVKSVFNNRIYSLPINLLTINSFFNRNLNPHEAEIFLDSVADKSITFPRTFEEQALRFVGKELYEAFFKGYTIKQWGLHPRELPSSILKRLPVRFNYDDNYYNSQFQGIPKNGYTYLIKNILDHENIELILNTKFSRELSLDFSHVFYSGSIDSWFNYIHGRLGYRTLDFSTERHHGDYQGNAVINYGNEEIPYTRISEHKHFSPWEHHEKTIIYKEYSRFCEDGDIPYYPIRLVKDKSQLSEYCKLAENESNVTFVGRLGTYRYLDMHVTIEEALNTSKDFLFALKNNCTMQTFSAHPLS